MQEVTGSTPVFSTKGGPQGPPFSLMPVAVYIIFSPSLDRYYVGHAEDPVLRLERDHNGGRNKSTKAGKPWVHRWVRWFETRAEAMDMERVIKARKSRDYIEALITGKKTPPNLPR
jgi:putative endonuclease